MQGTFAESPHSSSGASLVGPALGFGPYEVLGQIGRGGMARVFAARHRQLGSRRALKVVALEGAALQARFAREARAQGRVRHPNVLPVLDVLHTDRGLAMVLPLVAGPSLEQVLERHALSVAEAGALFARIVDGVAAIHEAGLVHRDLKPGNVLLDPEVDPVGVRIADFGLAKALAEGEEASLTRTHAAMGTPAYMAPEQFEDARSVGPAADVWALGCLLYELFTGLRFAVTRDLSMLPGEAEAWRPLLEDMLRPRPSGRPADGSAVRERLPATGALGPEWGERCRAMAPEIAELSDSLDTQWSFAEAFGGRGNLPADRDAFVGREQDLARVAARVADGARLVAILGPGGVGKTRLALRYARGAQEAYAGGAWFCDLSDARSRDGVCAAVASAFDVALGKDDPVAQLAHAIAGRGPCLVVLDNFEQVAAHAPATLGRWLDRCAEATFVVTTRQRLGVSGEVVVQVSPLEPEQAAELFVKRAAAAKDGFTLDQGDGPVVAELVALLDHLPLAIELVAARARAMSPRMLLSRIGDRFRLAAAGGRTDRHATLRAALDWSWELLADDERRGLAQLSVFEGGFGSESAEAVLELGEAWAIDVVQSLVDKSLVRSVGEDRFDLLVSVKAYAGQRLAELGGGPAAEARHGAWFSAMGQRLVGSVLSRAERRRLAVDLDNLVAACRRAVARGDGDGAAAALRATWTVLSRRGPFALGLELADATLATPSLSPGARALTAYVGQWAAFMASDPSTAARAQAALGAALAAGDTQTECLVRNQLGSLEAYAGRRDAAAASFEAALALAGATHLRALVLTNLGFYRREGGDYQGALALLEEAVALALAAGDDDTARIAAGAVAMTRYELGDLSATLAHWEPALAEARREGEHEAQARAMATLAILYDERGEVPRARRLYEASLALGRQVGLRQLESYTLGNLAVFEWYHGDRDRAVALSRDAIRLRAEIGDGRAQARGMHNLAQLLLERGERDEALALLHAALPMHAVHGDRLFEAQGKLTLGRLAVEGGERERGLGQVAAAVEQLRAMGATKQESDALVVQARLLADEDAPAALAALDRAERLARAAELPQAIASCLVTRVRVLIGVGDRAGATLAVEAAEALGLAPESAAGADVAAARVKLAGAR